MREKVVLISGGGSGFDQAMAGKFAAEGAGWRRSEAEVSWHRRSGD